MVTEGESRNIQPTPGRGLLDLGPREIALLAVLWRKGEVTVKQIHDEMAPGTVTVSTIHSALERLFRKGLVKRSKRGRSFLYRAAVRQSELIGYSIQEMARRLANDEKTPMIEGFIEYLASDSSRTKECVTKSLISCLSQDHAGLPEENPS